MPRPSALAYLLNPSLANLGRAYVEGKLEVEGHLRAMIDVANTLAHRALHTQQPWTNRWLRPLSHTRHEDAAAIAYHYDVSNAFYAAFLDPGMVYSCAYFDTGEQDLATAQLKKIDHILTKIRVRPGDRLLDIGCGWGSLVMRAAEKFGAQCTGITLSKNQYELATERIRAAGLSDKISIQLLPQGELPHIGTVLKTMQEGGLETLDVENLRRHYARTCSLWVENFERNATRIRSLVDERRYRIWRIYLAGCVHAFQHDWISVYQVVCGLSGRNANGLEWSRRYMYPAA